MRRAGIEGNVGHPVADGRHGWPPGLPATSPIGFYRRRNGVGLRGDATRQGISGRRCADAHRAPRSQKPRGALISSRPSDAGAMPQKIPRATPASPLGFQAGRRASVRERPLCFAGLAPKAAVHFAACSEGRATKRQSRLDLPSPGRQSKISVRRLVRSPEHPATRLKMNGLCRIQTPRTGGRLGEPEAASWYQVTLAAIGDAVLTTDPDGLVTYMNPVAETLTGWSAAEALGKRLEDVFRIVNEETRKPIEQPVRKVIDTGLVRGLANHTLLIARDGSELPIDDSAAPVWGEDGELVGVVMIFRDITERRRSEHLIESAREYAESIVTTVREPLLVLERRPPRQVGEPLLLRDLPGRAARDRRPVHLRPRRRPVGHPGPQDAARGHHPPEQLVRRLRGGARLRDHRPEDDAPQRPPLPARREVGADPPRHRGHHRTQAA